MYRSEDVLECIHDIQERLQNEVLFLNNGGCGVFASYLVEEMKRRSIFPKLRILSDISVSDDEINVEDVEKELKEYDVDLVNIDNWNDNGVFFSHIIVEWDGYFFDGYEMIDIDEIKNEGWEGIELNLLDGSISYSTMKLLAEYGCWNIFYDRDQNFLVHQIIKECFEKLDQKYTSIAA